MNGKTQKEQAIEITQDARVALGEAKQVLAQATENLTKSEFILEQTKQMICCFMNPVYAVSDGSEDDLKEALSALKDNPAKFIAYNPEQVQIVKPRFEDVNLTSPENAEQRKEADVMNAIMSLAVMNQNLFDINVIFSKFGNLFNVEVIKNGDYRKFNYKDVPRLMSRYVHFRGSNIDGHSPLEQLLKIEDELIDLIADIKDQQESDGDEVAA